MDSLFKWCIAAKVPVLYSLVLVLVQVVMLVQILAGL